MKTDQNTSLYTRVSQNNLQNANFSYSEKRDSGKITGLINRITNFGSDDMIERGKGSSEGATSPKILLRFLRN